MRFAALLAACLAINTMAGASTITISGSGTWDSTISSSTGLSAPNATWSFSFDVPNPLDANSTTMVTNASYSLNGSVVSDTITDIQFYDTNSYGLFDIDFASGDTLALYGAQIYNPTTLAITPGTYAAAIEDNDANTYVGAPGGEGSGTVTVGSVPEPSSLVNGGVAVAILVGLGLVRRTS